MTRSDEQIQRICSQLLSGNIGKEALTVTLEEFQKFYACMSKMVGRVPAVSLVKSIETEVFAQFSDIAPQHFIIIQPASLTQDVFGFLPNKVWHGSSTNSEKFGSFLRSELIKDWGKLGAIFIASLLLLFIANSNSLYELIATLLIQSGTVFLSIYLIFTVSQNQRLAEDLRLFESGILHKYYADDRNITLFAISTLSLTFLNTMIVSVLNPEILPDFGMALRLIKAISTAIVIMLLFKSFLTVANYYLGRTLDIIERDTIAEILHKDFQKHYHANKSELEK